MAGEEVHPLGLKVASLLDSCGKDGWDSYGAGALTAEAVEATMQNLAKHLFPTVNGGLMFEWDLDAEGSTLVVEFAANGELSDFYANNATRDVEWEAPVSGGSAE